MNFSLIIFVLIVSLLFIYNTYCVILSIISRSWDRIEATIIESNIETNNYGSEPDSYNLYIKYSYEIKGILFYSDRVYFGDKFTSSFKYYLNKIRYKYQPGNKVMAYVDSNNPNRAVLENDFKFLFLFNYIVGIITIIIYYLFQN